MFATCHLIADLMNVHEKETTIYMHKVIASAFESISSELPLSVQFAAARCLVKFMRKLPESDQPPNSLI